MDEQALHTTAKAMVAPGKGILAMDESTPTIGKRLQAIGVANNEDNRRAYRDLLAGASSLGQYINGAILYDETIRQRSFDDQSFPQLLQKQGILPGIKVDAGAKDLAAHPHEKVTEGLDGLRERLAEYKQLGAVFSKWRAVIRIDQGLPSRACIEANAHALARYAALCQEIDLVPIVEPEVLLDGDHHIGTCYTVTVETQRAVFEQLYRQGVHFDGMILKPSMVMPGKDCPQQVNVRQVAELTLQCLQQTVPTAVPGIAFLSGGQSDEDATRHLNSMNILAREMQLPWRLTFSYARALQHAAMTAWQGDSNNVEKARKALLLRARLNALASEGKYSEDMETQLAA